MADRSRETSLAALGSREFDVLVIGGGITGAGIARDAVLRGLSVALVEKNDFASGTSSRSSRLIHGGVRYLEQGRVGLVRESSAERARLLDLAPELVQPLQFVWPVYRGARISRWRLRLGLTAYDALAAFRNTARHRMLSTSDVLREEPRLRADALTGGARYFDARTDDARLTLANVVDAVAVGAVAVNHAPVTRLLVDRGSVRGAAVVDAETSATIEVRARVVVNATGPWSDDLRALEPRSEPRVVRGSKGAHLLVPRERVGNANAVTLLSRIDGRVMFVLPSGGGSHTIIGTTDSYTTESPEDVRASSADVEYLLTSTNAAFPDSRLTRDDVISAWAGIRPLVAAAGDDALVASREHAIAVSPSGLVSITGGKLTTFRVMAAQVVDVVLERLGRPRSPSPTRERPFPKLTAPDDTPELVSPELGWTVRQIRRAATHEFARTLGDVMIRRTKIAFETHDQGRALAPRIAAELAPLLAWNATRVDRELAAYGQEVARIFRIEER
jgi:glycerol-3-phosphate dehydrogenase